MRYRLLFLVVLTTFLFLPFDSASAACTTIDAKTKSCTQGSQMPSISWSITGGPTSCDLTTTYPTTTTPADGIEGAWIGTPATTASGTRDFGGRVIRASTGTYTFTCSIFSTIQSYATLIVTAAAPTTYTLTVNSTDPASGVAITSAPVGAGGSTGYSVSGVASGTTLYLTAPATASGNNFSSWTGCDSGVGRVCTVTVTANRTVTVDYDSGGGSPTYTVTPSAVGTGCSITPNNQEIVTAGGTTRSYSASASSGNKVIAFEVQVGAGAWNNFPGGAIGNVQNNIQIRATCDNEPYTGPMPSGTIVSATCSIPFGGSTCVPIVSYTLDDESAATLRFYVGGGAYYPLIGTTYTYIPIDGIGLSNTSVPLQVPIDLWPYNKEVPYSNPYGGTDNGDGTYIAGTPPPAQETWYAFMWTPDFFPGGYTIARHAFTASCATGSSWNGTICLPTYTVTFDPNGGSGAMSKQPIASGDTKSLFANTFTKDGSTFVGWAETPLGAVAYLDQANYTMGTADVTLYAKWNDTPTYTVNPSAGPNCSISPNTPQSVAAGGTSPAFSFTPNANYYVSGVYVKPTAGTVWTYAGVPSSLSIGNVTQNFDIRATCASFVAPTAMSGTCPPPGTSATVSWEAVAGATHYLLRIDDLADGWVGPRDIYIDDKTTRSHTFVPATNDASYSAWVHGANSYGFSPAASTTFSCGIPMHAITFNANGGTGTMIKQYIREGDTEPLFANKFTKAGSTFAGWAETPAGTVAYANQANYTMGTTDVTLYAVWTVATYTVTPSVVGSGCSISPNTVENVDHGASSSPYSATASAGYSVVAFEVRAGAGPWFPMLQGSSIGNVTQNFSVRATCGSGAITASDCGIDLNQSTCSSTVTWDVPLPTSNPHVYQMDQYIDSNKVAEGIWSGSVVRTVQYGTGVSNRFTVGYWDSNGVFQAMVQDTARGSCVSGTVWNGSVCRSSNSYTITPSAGANCSITPSDPEVVFSGGSSRSYTPSAAPGYYVSAFEVRAAITGAPWLPMPPGSSIGNVTQNFQIRALCAPLVKPAPITGTCPAPGTSATVSWGPVTGATFYALRVDNQTTGGWNNFCNESAGDFCEDIAGTSKVFASTATNAYHSWVHPCNAYGCAYAAPNTAYITFTCIPSIPACDFKINGSAGPISLLQGDMRNFSWNVIGATSCTASSSDVWSGSKNPVSGSESIAATTTSNHTLECSSPGGTSSCSVQVNVFCNVSTGSWGACNCGTETKTRTNINAACTPWVETGDCDTAEKNACRRDTYNWKEIAP